MAHLSEIHDFGLTRVRNRLVCQTCGEGFKADPRRDWDEEPMLLPCGWERCPNDCHAKAEAVRRASRRDPKGSLAPVRTLEESAARQAELAALRDLWDRYVKAFEEGKSALAALFYERYIETGGIALPLREEEKT